MQAKYTLDVSFFAKDDMIFGNESPLDNNFLVSSLVVSDFDSTDTKSREELSKSAMVHFEETVSRLKDGRYEVSLPWVNGHLKVSDNKDMAERRLKSTVKKLRDVNKIDDYQKIFDEWLQMGVIEKVPKNELKLLTTPSSI